MISSDRRTDTQVWRMDTAARAVSHGPLGLGELPSASPRPNRIGIYGAPRTAPDVDSRVIWAGSQPPGIAP